MEEIKAISGNPLKSCGYATYLMHMIERVTGRTFGYDKEHHPLKIKNDLKAPFRRAAAPMVLHPLELLEGENKGDKPSSPFGRCLG
jgi:hypothetical protein